MTELRRISQKHKRKQALEALSPDAQIRACYQEDTNRRGKANVRRKKGR